MSWQLPCRARSRKTPGVHYCVMHRCQTLVPEYEGAIDDAPAAFFDLCTLRSDPLQQLRIMRGSRCLADRPRRLQELAQLIALLVAQRLEVDLVLGLDLDWTALRTAVLELHRVAEGLQPRRQPRPGLLPLQSRQGLSIFGAMAYAAVTSWRLSRPSCGCVHRARLEQLGPVSPAALPKPIIGAGVH